MHISSATTAHAGLYFCRIVNTYGKMQWTVDSAVCAVSIQEGPATPVIEQDLEDSVTVASGSSLSLAASASSANGTLTCQWYKDDAALPNATSSSLFIEPVVPDDAGAYYCVFTNTIGDVTASARTRTCLVIYDDPDVDPNPTPDPEPTPEPEPTPDPAPMPDASPSPKPSQKPSRTHSPRPKATPIPSPSPTPKPSLRPTLSPKASAIPNPGPTVSPRPSPEPSANPTPSSEPKPIATVSPTPSALIATETGLSSLEPLKQDGSAILIGIGVVVILVITVAVYLDRKRKKVQCWAINRMWMP